MLIDKQGDRDSKKWHAVDKVGCPVYRINTPKTTFGVLIPELFLFRLAHFFAEDRHGKNFMQHFYQKGLRL
jgi:hypothetical protein